MNCKLWNVLERLDNYITPMIWCHEIAIANNDTNELHYRNITDITRNARSLTDHYEKPTWQRHTDLSQN